MLPILSLNNFAAWLVIRFFIVVAAFHAAIPFISEPEDAAVADVLGTSEVLVVVI